MHSTFTVIITTYNRLELLKRAIQSCLAQTVPVEVVVVDDGSIDGTQDYLQSLTSAVKVHCNTQNIGHLASLDLAASLATTTWLKFLDDDDYLAPNCIEQMQQALELYPDAVICSCQSIQIDNDGYELSRTKYLTTEQIYYIPQADTHYLMLIEALPFGTPVQVACQRQAFLQQQQVFQRQTKITTALNYHCDDIELWVRLATQGDAVVLSKHLVYRTIWDGGFNAKISIQDRLRTHVLIKQKMYELVSPKHKNRCPNLQDVQSFLHLHWGMIGIRHGQVLVGLSLILQALRSPMSLSYYVNFLRYRKLKATPEFDDPTSHKTETKPHSI
ncbi:MAG: glycosyltransferase family 2 protein [Cyanobacteria bacterium P01_H01_bin.121]